MNKSNMQSVQPRDDRTSAKRLREEIELHQSDLRWLSENSNHTIVYAVDNDIVRLFIDPKDAVSKPGREGYTQIFSGDDEKIAKTLGAVLSHHIFYTLGEGTQGAGTRLLIPPLDIEFASNLSTLLNLTANALDVAQTETTDLDTLLNDPNESEAELAQRLLDQAPQLFGTLLSNDSYAAQAKRTCALVNENKLTSIVDVNNHKSYGLPSKFIEVCLRRKSLPEMVWSCELKDAWVGHLDDSNYTEQRRKRIANDAEALASLQLINVRLAGSGIRLILITGAATLLNNGQKITVKNGAQNYLFSDLWLRHPRCFLGDPAILGSSIDLGGNNGDDNLMTLLDAFLAEVKQESDQQSQQTDEKNNQHVSNKYSMAIVEFQEKWNRYISNVCLGHPDIIEQVSCVDPSSVVIKLIREIRNAQNSLQDLLKESWQSVFFAAIQTGFLYSLYSWSLAKMMPRSLPRLIFESFNEATKFVDDVIMQKPGTDLSDFHERIVEVGNDSSNRYTTYLVFGVLFAAQNNWRVAESLADNAITLFFGDHQSVPEAVRDDKERIITGREAYYLKAVAKRHLARTLRDLISAHNSIILAIQMLDLEREVRGNFLPNDTRFEYELCSINVASAMFEKFMPVAPVLYGRLTTEQLLAQLNAILVPLYLSCRKKDCCGSCRECYRILTSFFIVELILACNIGDAFPDRLSQHLTHFRSIFSDEPYDEHKFHPTPLSKMIYSIADWWGESDVPTKEQKQTIALATIDHSIKSLRDGVGMPYERERCKYLRNFVMCDRDDSGMTAV